MNPRVDIIARCNGVGIDRDVALLRSAMSEAYEVGHLEHRRLDTIWPRWFHKVGQRHEENPTAARWNLLCERVPRRVASLVGPVALIPNQERFPHRHLDRLRHVDQVWCKSQHALEVFQPHARQVEYMGFTSVDRRLSSVTPDYGRFFHLAGRSTLKGTHTLLELWDQNPSWPELTLVQASHNAPKTVPTNVRLLSGHLPDQTVLELQNQCGIHLCPSLSEGWGHYIVEAMSCRAVVVTTDGPPMNELVDDRRGRVVRTIGSAPRHLGTNWYVDPEHLRHTIEELIQTPAAEKTMLGESARRWFDDNDVQFKCRLLERLGATA